MQRRPERLTGTTFDLLVIGGGISGACLAYDAALRGLSVALVEKNDFGGATSAASSKLLHGGIRYLQTTRWDKVRESALERARLQRIAPHLTRFVPFLIPTYPGLLKGRAALTAASALYEALCLGQDRVSGLPSKGVPRGGHLPRAELLRLVPPLEGSTAATGARVLYEVHMHSSERMTLAMVKSAVRHGAVAVNHAEAERLLVSGSTVGGAVVRDAISGERIDVRARLTANASGPWCMELNAQLGIRRLPRTITHFSKGAHIVTRQVIPDFALALPSGRRSAAIVARGGRHVFVIPWRGRSLVGTSDSPFRGTPDHVSASDQDIGDLLQDIGSALPGLRLEREDVLHAFAGLYPLTGNAVPEVYRGSGDYQIVDHGKRDRLDGFISVIGAKYTTARRLAERAVDLTLKKLGRAPAPCRTGIEPIAGGDIDDVGAFAKAVAQRFANLLDRDVIDHLASYGTEVHALAAVIDRYPTALARLAPDRESIEAEVVYAVEEEMAIHLDDVVFRRTGLGTVGHPGRACLARCAEIMGDILAWTPERRAEELDRVEGRFPLQQSTRAGRPPDPI